MVNWIRQKFSSLFNKQLNVTEANSELISDLEKYLGIQISHPEYFIKALTHRSYLELTPDNIKSNERLEFLGDSVLGLVVAEFLFKNFSDEGEGFLTKTRSHFVNRESLADSAEKMNFSHFILYDKRFLKGSREGMRTIMADALEALIGAIYLDSGLSRAKIFVSERIIKPSLKTGKFKVDRNFKGQLLEYTHATKLEPPYYKIQSEIGPDHDKDFTVEVYIGNKLAGKGVGKNKKSAEQNAAKNALAFLEGE